MSGKVIKSNFFSYYWFLDEKEQDVTSIRIYGINSKNENVCIRVDDFQPYIYLELPSDVTWTASRAQMVGNKIDQLIPKNKPISKSFEMKYKLYGAYLDIEGNKKKFPYLKCFFSNKEDIRKLGFALKKSINIMGIGYIKIKMHEQDADPILQLVCNQNIPTAGWITFKGNEVFDTEKLTLCNREFIVKSKNLCKYDKTIVGRPKIMGFDIEVNSSNPFAMPNPNKPNDKVFQISCVFAREGCKEEDYDIYLLTLGEPDQNIVGENVTIHMYDTEYELLMGFTELVREENPNVIVGYNILGFDINYMIQRAKEPCYCISDFDKMGFHKYYHAKEKTIKWSSSAYKNQEFQFLDAEGRLFVDLLPLIRRDYKFNNYQLKTVSLNLLGDTKDDLSHTGIFKCYRLGTKKEKDGTYSKKAKKAMGICGKYCIKDSILVVKLMEKMQTWIGLTEQASTYNTSIFSIYTQGQQIKVFSQVYKYCLENDIVVEKDGYITKEDERYVGAHVFPPVPGLYERVLPFDFASLYPTTIIAYNIDYSTIVWDDSIPDSKCNIFRWSDHVSCIHDPKVIRKNKLSEYIEKTQEKIKELREKRDKKINKSIKQDIQDEINKLMDEMKPYREERAQIAKTISKNPMCAERNYRFLKEPKGVIPTILQNLLDARKNTRKIIKNSVCIDENCKKIAQFGLEEDKNPKHCLDHKEENEIEFITSDKVGDIKILNNVLDKRQLAYKVSANSVRGTTPIPCRINGNFIYKTIEEISIGDWKFINDEQEVSTPIKNLEVWSDLGFTKPKYVMRHKMENPLYRVNTHTGSVDCTGDHSLLRKNGEEVKPKDLELDEELLHHDFPLPFDTPDKPLFRNLSNDIIDNYVLKNTEEELAFIHGLFFAEGTCGTWGVLENAKTSWIIYNKDIKLLERAKDILNKNEKETFKISNYYDSARCYHLVPTKNIIDIANSYRKMFYDKRNYKKFPDYIFNAPYNIRLSFLLGYYRGDGNRNLDVGIIIQNKGQIGSASLYYLAKSLGYKVSVSYSGDKDADFIYRLQCSLKLRTNHTDRIKVIDKIYQKEEEYDKYNKDKIIIRNNENIIFDGKKSLYRNITIFCDRFPREKLLNSLDDSIIVAENRNSYIVEYNTNTKKIKYRKYCCGKEYNIGIRTLKMNLPEIYNLCNCKKNITEKNVNNKTIYNNEEYKEYVYDIETENHHFAAGVGNMIVHNSMYGAMGVKKGYLHFMPGAMCTTYMGRTNIEIVAKTIQEKYKGKLVYGDTDCVLATEPVLIKYNNIFDYKTVEELSDGNWTRINPNKEISKAKLGYQIWSDGGFTDIINVVRCGIKKPLSRVLTHVGVVNCSNEHSLLTDKLESVTPLDIKIGDKLCISELPLPKDTPKKPLYNNKITKDVIENYIIPDIEYKELTAELAFVWGLFFADGSCGEYLYGKYTKTGWAINNQDNNLLERVCNILKNNEKTLNFKIYDTLKSSKVNKLEAVQFSRKKQHSGTLISFVNKYRNLFYDDRKYKKIPTIIFNSPFDIRQSFFMGYYSGDGSRKDPAISLSNKGAIGSAGLFYIMKSIGYQVSINTRKDKPDVYKLTGSTPEKKFRRIPNVVKKIVDIKIDNDEYIYDIQTKNHHFAAGVGQLVVHNSNYISFPHLKTAHESWDYAEMVAAEVSKLFPKPISLAFEEAIYWQFFILTKKRYMYRSCGRDGIVDKKIGKKGVILARRDNALIIRSIYEKIISMIFDGFSRDDILYYLITQLNEICSNTKEYKDYVVTKAVGDINNMHVEPFVDEKGKQKAKIGNYTVPILPKNKEEREKQFKLKEADSEEEYYRKCLPAVVQLAEKMRKRGQRVDNGSRLEYVIIDNGIKNDKQYNKLESLEYFQSHSNILKIDFMYYIKLLINPIDQLLNVAFNKKQELKYEFKKDFIANQYEFRSKNRQKVIDQIKNINKPSLNFI